MFNPTNQQIRILNCDTNCVVDAGPGSGKTTTIAHKLERIISDLKWYQGAIAISYTNKASDALESKTKKLCKDVKNSFFGTIDSFYISNIVAPFGKIFFGVAQKKLTIEKYLSDDKLNPLLESMQIICNSYMNKKIEQIIKEKIVPISELNKKEIAFIKNEFNQGKVDLRLVGLISNLIYLSSKSCRDYIKARYKFLCVDEFQDCGDEQYQLFLRIAEIGVIAWAVGDINQSIFRFANKSSKYLLDLMENDTFTKLPMNINHRCHPSIDAYSKVFLGYDIEYHGERRVFDLFINGNESSIGGWLENELSYIKTKFQVKNNFDIGVLARTDRTLELFATKLDKTPYKIFSKTDIDNDQTLAGSLFKELLRIGFDPEQSILKFIESYFSFKTRGEDWKISSCKKKIKELQSLCSHYNQLASKQTIENILEIFFEISEIIYPSLDVANSLENVRCVFMNEMQLKTFYPTETNQLQLMNLHKSKGLEFDVVIHLDLYDFIMPGYDWCVKKDENERKDSINLHYVGITRAKKALIFATGSKRFYASRNRYDDAKISELLYGKVENYRINWK